MTIREFRFREPVTDPDNLFVAMEDAEVIAHEPSSDTTDITPDGHPGSQYFLDVFVDTDTGDSVGEITVIPTREGSRATVEIRRTGTTFSERDQIQQFQLHRKGLPFFMIGEHVGQSADVPYGALIKSMVLFEPGS